MRLSDIDSLFQESLDENRDKFGEEGNVDEEKISKLVMDTISGDVFLDVYVQDKQALKFIFLPLMLGDINIIPWDTKLLYSYKNKSTGRGYNGYPTFLEFRYLRPKEFDLFCDYMIRFEELKNQNFN